MNDAKSPAADVSDEEFDALLEKDGAGGADARPAKGSVLPYDLVARDKIVRGRMPALDTVNERWVGEFQRRLSELMRRPVETTVAEVQLVSYGEWLATAPELSSLNLYAVKPWQRNALVAVDGKLLFALVDAYYGGRGPLKAIASRAELTRTERRLNSIVVALLVGQFQKAFEPIAAVSFEHQRTETDASYLQVATSSETVVVTRIDVTVKDTQGAMSLIMPLSLLESVKDKLTAGLKNVSKESQERWLGTLKAQLDQTELELASVFVETSLTVRELLELKAGDVLPIEAPKTATLFAGSMPLLTGKFGLSRGYNAISIVDAEPARARRLEESKT
jgi:flagellar motor switch protein FliM